REVLLILAAHERGLDASFEDVDLLLERQQERRFPALDPRELEARLERFELGILVALLAESVEDRQRIVDALVALGLDDRRLWGSGDEQRHLVRLRLVAVAPREAHPTEARAIRVLVRRKPELEQHRVHAAGFHAADVADDFPVLNRAQVALLGAERPNV